MEVRSGRIEVVSTTALTAYLFTNVNTGDARIVNNGSALLSSTKFLGLEGRKKVV